MAPNPIRVGLIGLSSRPAPISSPGAWAAHAHLPYLLQSPHYTLTALCNSSLQAAQAAIALHALDPAHVRAYGDPAALAADPEVDLVVCCVRVDRHCELVQPAILAGKDVYVEWPLASNAAQARELIALAEGRGVRGVVGLQGRYSPFLGTVRNLVGDGEGRLGRVLSSTMLVDGGQLGESEKAELDYFTDVEVGGNLVTIQMVHLLDSMTTALGAVKSVQSTLGNQRPVIALLHSDGTLADPAHRKTSHDQVLLQGALASGALFSFHMRGGKPFKDSPALLWRIYCARGEIRISAPSSGIWIAQWGMKIEVHDFASDSVRSVDPSQKLDNDPGDGLGPAAQNVARLYDAFAKGETGKYAGFEDALVWHEFVEKMYSEVGLPVLL